MNDHYALLEIPRGANEQDVKRAWARQVRLHPPDADPEVNRKLNEAKSVLLDPIARSDYDAQLSFGTEIAELFEEASIAMEDEFFEEAASLYREILALHPKSLEARNHLGLALAYDSRYRESVEQYEKLLELAPQSALYASNLGQVYSMWSDIDESRIPSAKRWLHRAIQLESHNSSHYVSLARLHVRRKEYKEAEVLLEDAINADGKVDIDDIGAFMELVMVLLLSDQKHRIRAIAVRLKEALPADQEIQQFAAFEFLRLAGTLVKDYGAFEAAAELTKAAKAITHNLGDLKGATDEIERIAAVRTEIERMMKDETLHPPVVLKFFTLMGIRSLGEEVDDHTFETLIQAASTWSQSDLRSGVDSCKQKYPRVMAMFGDRTEDFIRVGRSYASSQHQSAFGGSKAGTGCVISLLAFLALTLFVLTSI